MLCGKPFNETMIVQETDAQSLRDEVMTLREELREALKGYNELTRLGIQRARAREIRELKIRANDHVGKTTEKVQAIA